VTAVDASKARLRSLDVALAATAVCWGLALLALGGLRMYLAVSQYAWQRSLLHSSVTASTFHLGLPLLPLEDIFGLLWLIATPTWLVLAILKRSVDGDPRSKNYLVGCVLMALASFVLIIWHSADSLGGPFEIHLWTPPFVRPLLFVGDGVCGIAATAWVLLWSGS